MEEEEFLDENNASGTYTDISQYLEDHFNFPNSGQDIVKITKVDGGDDPGFAEWMNDKF